ncbi:MAG: glutamine--fructose-6-phosphate transaminase (isomerizing) [Spirochaetes bacterium]|nr:glutamine--fructose-6-phosphate transaminase (isomerizing) [Deltaproteobacteria bacterium]RKY02062.1 MAG: glutamine--fructose-6-phosphate transaminase (isomerizing) [Spirochaetota bacterium]
MCGIIGYIGERNIIDVLLNGLTHLEYRGYDSAGVALFDNDKVVVIRSEGKLTNLIDKVKGKRFTGSVGIGHTRWATHGKPSNNNAHPHKAGDVVVVHNGIIENYLSLKKELIKKGHKFDSDTDTEIIAHLIEDYMLQGMDFLKGVKKALNRIDGSYALGIICEREPEMLIAARNESPLIVGVGKNEGFIASDIPALLPYTRDMIFLEDGDLAVITKERVEISNQDKDIKRKLVNISWNQLMAEKGGFKHFMLKEIFEQPRAVTDTIRGRLNKENGKVTFEDFPLSRGEIKKLSNIYIIACGTSYHAALVGKFIIESLARIPVMVDIASEFRYRDPIFSKNSLMIGISQSGETADTLGAIRETKKRGIKLLSITNVVNSSIARESDGVIYTYAGPEISVASTKAFSTQITVLLLIALFLAYHRTGFSDSFYMDIIKEFVKAPHFMETILKDVASIEKIARKYVNKKDFLYLGRGILFPIALEGALKLKELSYVHAEGYPAGEMKHGPIALIDEEMPVVILAPKGYLYEKIWSNIKEIQTRDGKLIAVAFEDDHNIDEVADDVIKVPKTIWPLMPLVFTLPLQLLAYYIADFKGTDVDQPRNLAKSVTVE